MILVKMVTKGGWGQKSQRIDNVFYERLLLRQPKSKNQIKCNISAHVLFEYSVDMVISKSSSYTDVTLELGQ